RCEISRSPLRRGDDGKHDVAIARELAGADAGNLGKRSVVARAPPRQLEQRGVVEDDVGRHTLLLGECEAARAQRLPERLLGRGERLGAGNALARRAHAPLGSTSEGDGKLAAQHGGSTRAEAQAPVALDVDVEMAKCHELAEDRAPLAPVELAPHPESLETVVPEAAHALVGLAEEQVDEILDAE